MLSLELIGTMQMTVGNLAAAGVAYAAMEKAAQKRRGRRSGRRSSGQRDLVVAQNKVAEVKMAMGDLRAPSPCSNSRAKC